MAPTHLRARAQNIHWDDESGSPEPNKFIGLAEPGQTFSMSSYVGDLIVGTVIVGTSLSGLEEEEVWRYRIEARFLRFQPRLRLGLVSSSRQPSSHAWNARCVGTGGEVPAGEV